MLPFEQFLHSFSGNFFNMGLPVKLADELVAEARREAALNDRSLTAQVEHWAKLGRVAERVLPYSEVLQAKSKGSLSETSKHALTEALRVLLSNEPRTALAEKIASTTHPVYSADPDDPGLLIQILPNGQRTKGRMVARKFVPIE